MKRKDSPLAPDQPRAGSIRLILGLVIAAGALLWITIPACNKPADDPTETPGTANASTEPEAPDVPWLAFEAVS